MVIGTEGIKNSALGSLLQGAFEELEPFFVLIILATILDLLAVDLEGAPAESLPHLLDHKGCTLLLVLEFLDLITPLLDSVLKEPPSADLSSSGKCCSGGTLDLFFLELDILRQVDVLVGQLVTDFCKFPDSLLLGLDQLSAPTLLPKCESRAQLGMIEAQNLVLNVVFDANFSIREVVLPVGEVGHHVGLHHPLDAVKRALLLGTEGRVTHLLDVSTDFHNSGEAVPFERLLHQDVLLDLLVLSEGIKAALDDILVTSTLHLHGGHVLTHHVLPVGV